MVANHCFLPHNNISPDPQRKANLHYDAVSSIMQQTATGWDYGGSQSILHQGAPLHSERKPECSSDDTDVTVAALAQTTCSYYIISI